MFPRFSRFIAAIAIAGLIFSQAGGNDISLVRQLYFSGSYKACIEQVETALDGGSNDEEWFLLKIKAEMAIGEYRQALLSLQESLEANPNSIRLRWIGRDVCRYNNDRAMEREMLVEMDDMINFRSWRYRSPANQITIGRFLLDSGVDAKKVLDEIYRMTAQKAPDVTEVYLAMGDLALAKHNYSLAADNYRKATEAQPKDPEGFLGLARAYRPSEPDVSDQALKKVFEINKNHVPGMLFVINERIDAERYEEAESFIQRVLAVKPHQAQALAYRSVVAHLTNQPEKEDEYRKQALATWEANPEVDHLIGKKLSQKYRFAEGARYQRRSLVYDSDYLPAKMQLANDLLRLGDERQGWKLADEVFERDGYNIVAHNLVTLGNHMEKFETLEKEGFIVRMDPLEAKIYGDLVLQLLSEANRKLCAKYDSQIQKPIIVEIFPQQQDFAIRTFGLPGGAGFLGVCFGRVITMNSPASQGETPSNWKSVLWHEFCHVVTLQKTKNKMPRWLSEGISVYEELQQDAAWGQTMTPRFRQMILGDDLTPVSQLSSAFLNPKSPEHLQFAYFESSLVVEYLVETYGMDVLKRMLDDLGIGMAINEVLDRYAGSVKLLDKEFAEYAREKARQTAPDAEWESPSVAPGSDSTAWQNWVNKHPNNFPGLMGWAVQLFKEEKWQAAKDPLERMIKLFPEYRGSNNPYLLLAQVCRQLDESERELELLEKAATLQADSLEISKRLYEIYRDQEDWGKALAAADRILGVNPLLTEPHRYVALAAETTGHHQRAIQALSTLLALDPIDPAEAHFRLAKAWRNSGDLDSAKRQLLQCLEEAPRYLEAHELLLDVIEAINGDRSDSTHQKSDDPTHGKSESQKDDEH